MISLRNKSFNQQISFMLDISNLQISIQNKQIIKDFSLKIKAGEVHAIMGPNGAGKSTLGYALAGHPAYHIGKTSAVLIDKQNLLAMSPDQRAKAGLFLAFQYPIGIEGVTVYAFLRQAYRNLYPNQSMPAFKFRKLLKNYMENLDINIDFLNRYLNDGFSGGEKKRIEVLQMKVLKPKYAIFDETDSGLDVDALQIVATNIRKSVKEDNLGAIIITHYQRILNYIKPDFVHILKHGRVIHSGGFELIAEIEKNGYKKFI